MSSGYVRYNEDLRVPLSPPIWMMEVSVTNGEFKEETLHFNKTEMLSLVNRLRSAGANKRYYIVWHGQYNTDVFQVDPKIIANRLESEYDDYIKKQRQREIELQRVNDYSKKMDK